MSNAKSVNGTGEPNKVVVNLVSLGTDQYGHVFDCDCVTTNQLGGEEIGVKEFVVDVQEARGDQLIGLREATKGNRSRRPPRPCDKRGKVRQGDMEVGG